MHIKVPSIIFLRNNRIDNFEQIVNDLLLPYLNSFPRNLMTIINEYGERFHHAITIIVTRYRGKWSHGMLADYCWTLKKHFRNQFPVRKLMTQRFNYAVYYLCIKYC